MNILFSLLELELLYVVLAVVLLLVYPPQFSLLALFLDVRPYTPNGFALSSFLGCFLLLVPDLARISRNDLKFFLTQSKAFTRLDCKFQLELVKELISSSRSLIKTQDTNYVRVCYLMRYKRDVSVVILLKLLFKSLMFFSISVNEKSGLDFLFNQSIKEETAFSQVINQWMIY